MTQKPILSPPGRQMNTGFRRSLRQAAVGLSLLAFTALQAQFNYTFTAVGGTYTQVSAGGTDLNSIEVDDAHSAAITLPFDFGYDGTAVNTIKVNSNGWISMASGDAPSAAQGRDNSSFGGANANVRPGIFPLWDDLDGASGTARYETTGSAPNRVFTMEWRNWQWNYNATGTTISFECKLYETTNVIEFVYRAEAGALSSPSASIGLLASGSGSYYSLNGTGGSPTASTSSATVNLSTKPATGQIYRFTPTGCTGPSISSTTSNSPICASSALTLTTTATGTAPLAYSWSGTGTFNDNGISNPTVTGAATGTYTVTVLNWCGTSATDNESVTVTPTPTTANAGTDQSICLSNTSTSLAGNTPVIGTGAWSILAGSPNTSTSQLSSTSSPTATFTPTTTGTYTLRWTISNSPCTASTNDVVITVNPFASLVTQTFNASGTFNVPAGVTEITVQAWGGGGSGGGSNNAGGINARVGAGGGGGAFVSKLLTVTPGSPLSVVVGASVNGASAANGTDGNPSTITGSEALVFADGGNAGAANNAGGTPTGGSGGSLAASQGDTETAGANGGNGASGNFATTGGAGGAGASGGGAGGATIAIFTTASGSAGAAPGGGGGGGRTQGNGGNTSGGTGAAGRIIISYTPVPSVSASLGTICAGGSSLLTASGGSTFLWSPGGATTSSINVSPGTTTTYSVTVTNTCPGYLTQEVVVNPLPTATASGGGTVCSIDPLPDVTFTFTGAPPYNFTYNPGGVVVTGHGTNTYTINNAPAGTYTVTALSDANCIGTSFGSSATVTVNTAEVYYADTDGDGFGSGPSTGTACAPPNAGDVTNSTDNCPDNANALQIDTDGDNIGDACDPCDNLTDGDACDDGNPCTTGETLLNCVCQGGSALPDTDGDGVCDAIDNCVNDVNAGQEDTDADLVGDVCDNCPNDPNVGQTDTDGDGLGDACDACPNDPDNDIDSDGVCGDVDNCPTTANAGQEDVDADGVGDVCDICPGSDDALDADADGVPDGCDNCVNNANPTQEDADADDIGDVCDNCPTTPGVIGTACDDSNCFTVNDVLDGDCICAGTPVACDNWTLTIEAGTNGGQISWQIVEDGGPCVLASGSGYSNGSTNNVNVCVPQGNCFNLTFTDSGNDGISGGGWKLTDNLGRSILDNVGNGGCFATTTSTALAFCNEPSSAQTLIPIHCDKENWIISDVIIASVDAAVSSQYGIGDQTDDGYQFWFQSTCGTYSRRVFRNHATSGGQGPANALRASKLALSSIYTNPLPVGELLNVRVRTRVNGSNGAWGPACRFKLDPTACTVTQLNGTISSPNYSCGANGKVVGAGGNTGKLFADVVTSGGNPATNYRFLFAVPGEGYARNVVSTNAACLLAAWQTNPLLCGTYTYEVRVQASFDGGNTYCPVGPVCNVTITNNQPVYCTTPSAMAQQSGTRSDNFDGGDFAMYPNPNRGDELFVNMTGFNTEVSIVTVDIYDLFGKRVMNATLPVQDGFLNTALELGKDMAAGLYMVNVTAGDITKTERLVIQR